MGINFEPQQEGLTMKERKGLFRKYTIQKTDGSPTNPNAQYFVLRHDPFGDHCHVEASRAALSVYADKIEPYYPELATDIRNQLKGHEMESQ